MAITNLKVNTNRMDSDVQKLNGGLNQTRAHLQNIHDAMDRLHAMWEGAARDAKKQRFDTAYQNMTALCDLVQKMIDQMDQDRKEYDSCENQVMDAVNALNV